MKARVTVMPKQAVLDPQGVAVRDAMHQLGLSAASAVRVGKFLEIEIAAGPERAELEKTLHALCRDLLSNPVIEDYRLELAEGDA
jgi:phosphoribosylformylglycinamidine synthase